MYYTTLGWLFIKKNVYLKLSWTKKVPLFAHYTLPLERLSHTNLAVTFEYALIIACSQILPISSLRLGYGTYGTKYHDIISVIIKCWKYATETDGEFSQTRGELFLIVKVSI